MLLQLRHHRVGQLDFGRHGKIVEEYRERRKIRNAVIKVAQCLWSDAIVVGWREHHTIYRQPAQRVDARAHGPYAIVHHAYKQRCPPGVLTSGDFCRGRAFVRRHRGLHAHTPQQQQARRSGSRHALNFVAKAPGQDATICIQRRAQGGVKAAVKFIKPSPLCDFLRRFSALRRRGQGPPAST